MEAIVNKLAAQESGIVFLSAPTNSGKTKIVHALKNRKEKTTIIAAEESFRQK